MFSNLAIAYLFLGGSGAGLCLLFTFLSFNVPREFITVVAPWRVKSLLGRRYLRGRVLEYFTCPRHFSRLFSHGYFMGCAVMALGALCLLLDLGKIDAAHLLFTSPHMSFIAFGSWVLAFSIILSFVLSVIWIVNMRVPYMLLQMFTAITSVFMIATVGYTGFLVAAMPSVPLWNSPYIPPIFIASSLSCGTALAVLLVAELGYLSVFKNVIIRITKIDSVIIVLEIVLILAYSFWAGEYSQLYNESLVMTDNETTNALILSSYELFYGQRAGLFIGIMFVGGLILPFVLDFIVLRVKTSWRTGYALVFSSVCVLVGGFMLRYCIVMAGMQPMFGAM